MQVDGVKRQRLCIFTAGAKDDLSKIVFLCKYQDKTLAPCAVQ